MTVDIPDYIHINWPALDKAEKIWNAESKVWAAGGPRYREWLLKEAGIEYAATYIKIVDKEQYLLFLLRYA